MDVGEKHSLHFSGPDDCKVLTCNWVVTSDTMVGIAQEGSLAALTEEGMAHSTLKVDKVEGTLEEDKG